VSILRLLRRSENSINFALLLNFILANVLVSFKFISIFSLSWILLPFPVPFVIFLKFLLEFESKIIIKEFRCAGFMIWV